MGRWVDKIDRSRGRQVDLRTRKVKTIDRPA
jgi:hypothetical protein